MNNVRLPDGLRAVPSFAAWAPILAPALAMALGLASGAAQAVPERLSRNPGDAISRLKANAGGELVREQRAKSAFTLLRARRGEHLMADGGVGTPEQRARFFLSVYGTALGIDDPAAQLESGRASTDLTGKKHVHLDQVHAGLPVFGARVAVHMTDAGITGVGGVFIKNLDTVSPVPTRALASLRTGALGYAGKLHRGASLAIQSGRYVIYPVGLIQGHLQAPRLAYEAMVGNGADIRERIFVDARNGQILDAISEIHHVLNREIYFGNQSGAPSLTEGMPTAPADPPLIADPGHGSTDFSDPAPGEPEANLYVFAGGTYALYANMFGREGYDACDGTGPCETGTAPSYDPLRGNDNLTDFAGQIQQSVYLINQACPNAYWNGTSTNYCPGFDADDVVSHEWSHGYTEYTADLVYAYQSGALNESYSDIFGETYDLLNHIEGPLGGLTLTEHQYYEDAGSRWVVGEDLSEEAAALLLRDMWKPDDFPATTPGKATSGNYTCGTGDGGGVHTNSSVPNHTYAMLVDGTAGQGPPGTTGFARDSYNGQSFVGLGMIKAAHIYFQAHANYETPTTDFPQHADYLRTACEDLIGIILNDQSGLPSGQIITEGDCETVNKALLATEMDLGAPCPFAPVLRPTGEPELCAGAQNLFAEDWESGDDGWTKTSAGRFPEWEDDSRAERDFRLVDTLPQSHPSGIAAFAKNIPIGEPGGGTCTPGGDYGGAFTYDSPSITIPAGATDLQLRFDHYVNTEATADGGQVEISADGGSTYTLVAQDDFLYNPPNSTLLGPADTSTNPEGGEWAWNGADVNPPSGAPPANWGTTVVNVVPYAGPGDTVKLRFKFAQEGCNGRDGWYVDDIRLDSCVALEGPTLSTGDDYEDPDTDGTFSLSWIRPPTAVGPDLLQRSTTACAPLLSDDASSLSNWTETRSDPAFAPAWQTSTTKPQHQGNSAFWANPVSEQETQNSSSTLTYGAPIALPAGQNTLRFKEWYFNEDDDKGIVEISTNDGAQWLPVYVNNRPMGNPDTGAAALAEEDLATVEVDLTPYAGKSILLRFTFELGESNFFAYTQYGWYVDDIQIVNANWGDVLSTAATGTTRTAQPDGQYCFRVRTSYSIDSALQASPFSNVVNVVVASGITNFPPVADAGDDLVANEGDRVTLDGTGSDDPDGGTLSYSWQQLTGQVATLSGANTARPSFDAPGVNVDSILTFQLTVSDGGLSRTDTVAVTVKNIVLPTGSGTSGTSGDTVLGGAFAPWTLLVLGLAALRRRIRIAAALVAALLFSSTAMALPERASVDAGDALARLRANAGGRLVHAERPASAYAMVRATGGRVLMDDGALPSPLERAQFFLSIYGAALNVTDPATQLALQRVSRDAAGNHHVHLDQVHRGIPVFGARLVVHMNARGILGASGTFVPDLKPSLAHQPANIGALRAAALEHARVRHPRAPLAISSGRLVVYPQGLLQRQLGPARLAYEAMVTSRGVRERVVVDARTHRVLERIDERHALKNREIYNGNMDVPPTYDEDPGALFPAGPADPALINDPGHNSTDPSDKTTPDVPVNNLWTFAGGTYALYANLFDRQGYDDCDLEGPCRPEAFPGQWPRATSVPGQLQQSVYLINNICPNAYWDGTSTNYCPGFDADDIVSHEWSHAYTEYTHGLIYAYQSGALNESYSDIFGETYDLTNNQEGPLGSSTLVEHKYYEEGGSRWVMGEDLSEEAAALLLRDMWDPDAFPTPSPGKVSSENYHCASSDGGGVHTNSGVPNHAYAMLVDGKTYNNITVPGIGMIKAAHIYFQAESHYQTPTSGFAEHSDALEQSCQDLKGIELRGLVDGLPSGQIITQTDCDALAGAIAATEMHDEPLQCGFTPLLDPNVPEGCGLDQPHLYQEDWETGMDGWAIGTEGLNAEWPDTNFVLRSNLPLNADQSLHLGSAAFAINPRIGEPNGGLCEAGNDVSGHYWMDSPEITIPTGAANLKLTFEHFVQTEATFDGGNVKVSVNGGDFTAVPGSNYLFNGPNFANTDTANTNPLTPEAIWSGADGGESTGSWGTSIVDLEGLASPGDKVKVRFDFGQDGCNGNLGWFVDRVRLLQCELVTPPSEYLVLHMHGNPQHDAGHPDEPDCTGNGASDIIACNGPFLSTSAQLGDGPSGRWDVANPALDGTNPRTIYDPSWMWFPTEPTVLGSPMRLKFWASCGACSGDVATADWAVRLYIGGSLKLEKTITATPAAPNVPSLVSAEIPLSSPLVASGEVILHVDPLYIDTQQNTHIYYDSALPCTADVANESCDSFISFGDLPVETGDTVCEAPGLPILSDPAGDIFAPIGQTSNAAWDVRKLSASQPYFENGAYKIAFHLKVENLAVMPQNTVWPINFCSPAFPCVNPDVNTKAYGADNKYYTVRAVSPGADNPGAEPIFQILQPTAGGNTVAERSKITADPSSGYNADGTITMVVNAADIGLNPANAGVEKLTKFQVRVRVGSDTSGGTTPDNMPDGLAGDGQFQTVPLAFCAPGAAPVPTLAADPLSGLAPLDVEFTIGGSDADGDELASYTIDFGDGETLTDQPLGGATTAVLMHTYDTQGSYVASLTLKDAGGRVSTTAATQTITVTVPDVPPIADAGDDDTFVEGTPATLDGSGSNDPDGQALSYAWTQIGGTNVALTGANTASPSFTAPTVCGDELLTFRLTVTTATGTDTDDVAIIVDNVNTLPVAEAGEDFTVKAGHDGMLSAAGTQDPDCDTLNYQWLQTHGTPVTLSDAASATPTFTAPGNPGEVLRFRLTVTDGDNVPSTDFVLVEIVEDPVIGNNEAGGLGWLTLAGLGIAGLVRRKRRQ